jgi:hypothetical protein
MTCADTRGSAVTMQAALWAAWYTYVGMRVLLLVTLVTGALIGGCTVSIQTAARTCWNTSAKSTQCHSCVPTNTDISYEISSSQDMEYGDYWLLGFCTT